MHESARNEMARLIEKHSDAPAGVLDVGSYDVNGSYRDMFDLEQTQYCGVDIRKGPGVDIVVGEYSPLPLMRSNQERWPLVVSGSTLEHCLNPFRLVQRIADAMAPGGIFVCTTPAMFHYHEHPIDCFRFWPAGLASVCEEAGLEVLEAYFIEIKPTKVDTYAVARKPED